MKQQIAILGRTPALSLAELESVYGAANIFKAGNEAALLSIQVEASDHTKMGGIQKLGEVLEILDYTDWDKVKRYLTTHIIDYTAAQEGAKVKFGISTYDVPIKPAEVNATALTLKKALKAGGFSCRVIANKQNELNSAQVIHGGLLTSAGTELLIVKDGNRTIISKTSSVQDIDAYAARDQARPMRDARVGMLPPKLAQIIINLSSQRTMSNGKAPTVQESERMLSTGFSHKAQLLDPFCGTGVILQEATLMNYPVIGTDLDPRMIDYSEKNLAWLAIKMKLDIKSTIQVADATTYKWKEPFDIIACETYLGRALSSLPDQETLNKIINDCNTILNKFLNNVARQTKPGFRMCIAVPAWRVKNGFKHLPVLDSIRDLGYNRISFVHANTSDLIYHRKDQIVARELVVLERK